MSYPDPDKASDDPIFRDVQDALALSEQDTFPMGAPNKQPGSQGGAGTAHTHAPNSTGQSASKVDPGMGGVGGTTKRGGTPPKNPANKNRLH